MKRTLLAFVCILLPIRGFSQHLSLTPSLAPKFPLQQTNYSAARENLATQSVPPFQLFPVAAGWWQNTAPTTSAGVLSPANSQKHPRPHLIELSAANWRPLTRSDKFSFFWRDIIHWGTHVSLVFDTSLSYATGDRTYLGPGVRGFFTRYGLNVADEANFTFFNAFFFPTIFHQDPRYIPSDHGKIGARLGYALSRVLIARTDSGGSAVNTSKIAGEFIATAISSIMYSNYGADIGMGENFIDFGMNLVTDAAFDVFKEFWPDMARKMKLNLWLRNMVRASLRDYTRVS